MPNLSDYFPQRSSTGYAGDTLIDLSIPSGLSGNFEVEHQYARVWNQDNVIGSKDVVTHANGYVHGVTGVAWNNLIRVTPPARVKSTRILELHGKFTNVVPGSWEGVRFLFNWQDASNFYIAGLQYNASSQFELVLAEYISGVYTSRGGGIFTAGVDYPCDFRLAVYDGGDEVWGHAYINETSDVAGAEIVSDNFADTPRLYKSAEQFQVQFTETPEDFCQVSNLRVSEI